MIVMYRMFYICLFLSFTNDLYAQSYHINQYNNIDDHYFTSVNQIIIDNNENIWIGTHSGLFMYNGQKLFDFSEFFFQKRILYLLYDKNVDLLHVIDGQANYYNINTMDFIIKKQNILEKGIQINLMNGNKKPIIYFDLKQKLTSLTITTTKFYYIDTVLIAYSNDNNLEIRVPTLNSKITDLVNKGKLLQISHRLFLFHGDTLYELLYENGKIDISPKVQRFNLHSIKNKINALAYNEKNGRFYFGSYVDGLFEATPKNFQIIKPDERFINSHPKQNLTVYYSQCEDESGNIYINNHLMVDREGNWSIHNNIKEYGISVNYKDKNNNIFLMDEKPRRLYQMNGRIHTKIKVDSLHDIFISATETMDSLLIFISSSEVVFMKQNKIVQILSKNSLGIKTDENLSYIYYNKNEQNGKIFLLSNKNIYQFDWVKNKVIKIDNLIAADYRIMQPLKGKYHFTGTYGHGFLIFDGEKWTEMPLDNKGCLKFAHGALIDDNGHVWISTNHGLFRTRMQDMVDFVNGKTKEIFYFYYDKTSGFNTNEFNGGCQSPAIKLRDGRFSYSSMDGLVQFDPLKVPASFPLHKPNIIDLKRNNQSQDSIPTSLVITQDIKDIKLEVSTTFYGHPNNLQIQYKIQGYVDQWTNLTDQRFINLQNATYGDYNIKIRQRIGFGSHDFEYISYPLVVLPYFYQTWWFKVLLGVIGLSLAYIFSRWYSRYTIQKNKELEMLILERNKEVLQTNEVLQEQVKQNDLFQSIFVHDIKSPIRFITSNTALLKTHWNHLDTTIKQDQISHIHDAATKIDHFIEETLLWIKIRNGELQLETNDFQALAMIQKCIDFHKASDKIIRGDIQILTDVRQDLFLTQDERLLATIVRNLISNSIKYTTQGKIIVYFLSNPNGSFTIGCQDTGKGMPKSLVEKLLSDHYRGNDIRDDSFKMGYVIIKEIVRLIGGQLHIESEENHGTDVRVVF